MTSVELVDIEGDLLDTKEKAIQFTATGDKADAVWLPLSLIEVQERPMGGPHRIIVTLPQWLAEDRKLV